MITKDDVQRAFNRQLAAMLAYQDHVTRDCKDKRINYRATETRGDSTILWNEWKRLEAEYRELRQAYHAQGRK